jgi:tetratricopeptide (TPR) repeat protein
MLAGSIAFYKDWDWDAARQSLNRALELNPGNESALQILGDYYEMLGDWDRSIALGINSVKAAPNSTSMRMNLGLTYNYSGAYDKGLESCDTGESPEDMSTWIAACVAESYAGMGDMDNATRYAKAAMTDPDIDQIALALMAVVLGASGETEIASDIWRDLQALAESEYVSPVVLAYTAFGAGNLDEFFEHLDTAINEKAIWAPWFAAVPQFESARSDPRFAEMVSRLNLPGTQ